MGSDVIGLLLLVALFIAYLSGRFPLGLTACVGAVVMGVLGYIQPADVIANFNNGSLFLIGGMTVVSTALFKTGVAQAVGENILKIKIIQKSEKLFLLVVITIVMVLSCFMSNTATTAMMLPLVASIAAKSNGVITKKHLYMAIGIAAIAGGNLSLAGSTPQVVTQGLLEEFGLRPMEFFELGYIGGPVCILFLIFCATFGYSLMKKVFDFPEVVDEADLGDTSGEANPFHAKRYQICAVLIFAFCVVGFVMGWYNVGVVAFIGSLACVFTGILTDKELFAAVPWNACFIVAGSLAFANGLRNAGTIDLIVNTSLGWFGGAEASRFAVFAVLLWVSSFLTQVVTNTAVPAVVVPIAIGLANGIGADPMIYAMAVTIASNISFATPVGAVPMAMSLPGGYRFKDYIKIGGLFNVLAVLLAMIIMPAIWPL